MGSPAGGLSLPFPGGLSRKELAAWVALLLIAGAAHFFQLGDRVLSYDEGVHAFYSFQLAETGLYQHNPVSHGPLLFYLNALVFSLLPATDLTARLAPALAGTFLVLSPLLFRRWLGCRIVLVSGVLLTISPLVLYFGRYLRNEVYLLLLLSLWIYGIFRYLERRELTSLYVVAIASALSVASKEVAFISATGLTVFLLLVILRSRFSTGRQAIDLVAFHVAAFCPFSLPLVLRLTGLDSLRVWLSENPTWAAAAVAVCMAIAAGGLTIWRITRAEGPSVMDWLKLISFFWAILLFYFSSFLSYLPGIYTSFFQSLDFWLSQQPVGRGGQPFYYYGIVLAAYEFLPALLALGGLAAVIKSVVVGNRARHGWAVDQILPLFFAWWALFNTIAYSLAGEKMPWLALHILLPLVYLAALFGDLCIRSGRTAFRTSRFARVPALLVGGAAVAGVLLTLGVAYRLNFLQPASPRELASYAQGGDGVVPLAEEIQKLARRGRNVVVSNEFVFPLTWYLREEEVKYGDIPSEILPLHDVAVVSAEQTDLGEPVSPEYAVLWWPRQDYFDLSEGGAASLFRWGTWSRLGRLLYPPVSSSGPDTRECESKAEIVRVGSGDSPASR